MADMTLLDEVRHAAQAALEAHSTGEDAGALDEQTRSAARAALDAGHAITAIAGAQQEGERAARERVGSQVLRAVERTAKKVSDATGEHERAVAQAVRLGLPARDIAARAGVSHGTVAAVARRREEADAAGRPAARPGAGEGVDAGESVPEAGTD